MQVLPPDEYRTVVRLHAETVGVGRNPRAYAITKSKGSQRPKISLLTNKTELTVSHHRPFSSFERFLYVYNPPKHCESGRANIETWAITRTSVGKWWLRKPESPAQSARQSSLKKMRVSCHPTWSRRERKQM